jgi:hypothetical protein
MGKNSERRKLVDVTTKHLKALGEPLLAGRQEPPLAAAWLQQNFVVGLLEAAREGAQSWQNQAYLAALSHYEPAVRRGIREVMNNVLTAGLEPGHLVFALLVDAEYDQPQVVGEFVTCEPVEAWVSQQLGVPLHNVRAHHTAMFAPAHAGLFSLMTTLSSVTQRSRVATAAYVAEELKTEPFAKPRVRSRKVEDASKVRQTLMFLVSVFTDRELDLAALKPAEGQAPVLELTYWGDGSEEPIDRARLTPREPALAFDSMELLGGFRETLAKAEKELLPVRPANATLEVIVRKGTDFRFKQGCEVLAKWRGTDMPHVLCYIGSFAEWFIPQLERLGVPVARKPGVLPAPPAEKGASPEDLKDLDSALSDLMTNLGVTKDTSGKQTT